MKPFESAPIVPLFHSPLLMHRWPDSDALNASLRALILERSTSDPGRVRSNAGGWQSGEDFAAWAGAPGAVLIQRAVEMANHATAQLLRNVEKTVAFSWQMAMWANINRRSGFNELHCHPGSTWSGVYYVDAGVPEGGGASGRLRFLNPVAQQLMSFLSDFTRDHFDVDPAPGMMVLFPSYLQHQVTPHPHDAPRISVAFNLRKDPYP
ncbi:MAG: hypothetical protein EPO40_07370 [Myxococcaceae bacterium]|nr:MAG: hypothetical protein EPO40_07370 [Myxococcaceae bacterium]